MQYKPLFSATFLLLSLNYILATGLNHMLNEIGLRRNSDPPGTVLDLPPMKNMLLILAEMQVSCISILSCQEQKIMYGET